MVYQWINNNLSHWLPQACSLCGQSSGSQALCSQCLQDLPRIQHACLQCGLPLADLTQPAVCGHCLKQPPNYDRVTASFAYASPVSQLVSKLKFRGQIQLAQLLGELLRDTVRAGKHQVQAILPVPLHHRRLRQRGLNQSLEIARPLSYAFDIPLMLHSITRLRDTLPQSDQQASERARNVRNAFQLNEVPPYRSVAIVDDVMTSGHTVNEIAKLLRQAGTEQIEVWCVARAWPHTTAGWKSS